MLPAVAVAGPLGGAWQPASSCSSQNSTPASGCWLPQLAAAAAPDAALCQSAILQQADDDSTADSRPTSWQQARAVSTMRLTAADVSREPHTPPRPSHILECPPAPVRVLRPPPIIVDFAAQPPCGSPRPGSTIWHDLPHQLAGGAKPAPLLAPAGYFPPGLYLPLGSGNNQCYTTYHQYKAISPKEVAPLLASAMQRAHLVGLSVSPEGPPRVGVQPPGLGAERPTPAVRAGELGTAAGLLQAAAHGSAAAPGAASDPTRAAAAASSGDGAAAAGAAFGSNRPRVPLHITIPEAPAAPMECVCVDTCSCRNQAAAAAATATAAAAACAGAAAALAPGSGRLAGHSMHSARSTHSVLPLSARRPLDLASPCCLAGGGGALGGLEALAGGAGGAFLACFTQEGLAYAGGGGLLSPRRMPAAPAQGVTAPQALAAAGEEHQQLAAAAAAAPAIGCCSPPHTQQLGGCSSTGGGWCGVSGASPTASSWMDRLEQQLVARDVAVAAAAATSGLTAAAKRLGSPSPCRSPTAAPKRPRAAAGGV